MMIAYYVIYGLLIFLCLAGLCSLFFVKEYARKIACLSVSYSSFLVFIILLSLANAKLNEVLVIMVSTLAIFSVNLLIGIGIARNISESREEKSS